MTEAEAKAEIDRLKGEIEKLQQRQVQEALAERLSEQTKQLDEEQRAFFEQQRDLLQQEHARLLNQRKELPLGPQGQRIVEIIRANPPLTPKIREFAELLLKRVDVALADVLQVEPAPEPAEEDPE